LSFSLHGRSLARRRPLDLSAFQFSHERKGVLVRRYRNAQHSGFFDDETVHKIDVGRPPFADVLRIEGNCVSPRGFACVRLVMSSLISAIASLFPSEASGSMSGFSS
jgi:hypothetical protein